MILPSHQGTRGHFSVEEPAVNQRNRTVCKAKHHAECGCGKQPTGFCCSLHSLCLRGNFDKAQHSLTHSRNAPESSQREPSPDILNPITTNPQQTSFSVKPQAFPPRSGAGQGWPLPPCLFQFPPVTCFGASCEVLFCRPALYL